MLSFTVVGWTLLFATIGASANPVTKSGYVEDVEIQCSYQFASTNPKYFCRDPCTENKHILIKSDQSNPSYTGRYRLKDYGKGVLYVTITDLQKSDTGTYWCGVDRLVKDTFHKVFLTVKDARPPRRTDPPRPPAPAPERTSTSSTSTIPPSTPPTNHPSTPPTIPPSTPPSVSPSAHISSRPSGILVCVGVGLVSVAVFGMVALYSVLGALTDLKHQSELSSATFSTVDLEEEKETHSEIFSTLIYYTVKHETSGSTADPLKTT